MSTLTNLENTTLINCKLFEYFAQHLMLECKGCNEEMIKDEVVNFMNELIKLLGAETDLLPQTLKHFDDHHILLIQIIEKGHITLHFVDDKIFLDIFSCKRLNIQKIKNLLAKSFKPKTMKETSLDRGI